jgi:hypothetical protein
MLTWCQDPARQHVSMVMRRLVPATLLLSVALALPTYAQAGVPPGLSGANQYKETLPGAGGDEPTSELGAKGASPAQALGHENAARLEALGADGRSAARLAAEGVPRVGAGAGSKASGHVASTESSPGSSSSVSQVLGQVTGASDSGGMGLLLPLLIAMTAIAATAFGIGRRALRGRS